MRAVGMRCPEVVPHQREQLEVIVTQRVSPQEIMDEAKEVMLQGQSPQNWDEQIKLINFLAVNIALGREGRISAIKLIRMMFPEDLGEVSDGEINKVVTFQLAVTN
jgi:hypothetical protein